MCFLKDLLILRERERASREGPTEERENPETDFLLSTELHVGLDPRTLT